jgi:hypothetical protein
MAERELAQSDELEDASGKPEPSSDQLGADQLERPALEDEKERRDSRLAMSLQEAEIIARNLKESGTRR